MNLNTPNRVEHQLTDKGYVPVYTTAVVEQPWATYSSTDHEVWATLFKRQREVLVGRASDEFLRTQAAMGMTPDRIPKFDDLNRMLRQATGWELVGVEGLLPELTFFDHLANRRFPVTWWIRKPEQLGLPGRAGPVPRPVRPCAAADESGASPTTCRPTGRAA
jgi:phenylalanine-4-hydroxylase